MATVADNATEHERPILQAMMALGATETVRGIQFNHDNRGVSAWNRLFGHAEEFLSKGYAPLDVVQYNTSGDGVTLVMSDKFEDFLNEKISE
jgi:hypothetical protein